MLYRSDFQASFSLENKQEYQGPITRKKSTHCSFTYNHQQYNAGWKCTNYSFKIRLDFHKLVLKHNR